MGEGSHGGFEALRPPSACGSKELSVKVRNRRIPLQKKARITSKGQITVPRQIRRLLGVSPGDSLVFEGEGARVRVRPVKGRSPFARYRGIGNPGISTGRQAIIRWIRTLRGE